MIARLDRTNVLKWLLVWGGIGCVFAIQLRLHYGVPWSLSVFWGLSDWYLWGVLALGVFAGIRELKRRQFSRTHRIIGYIVLAPLVMAIHVALTIVVGSLAAEPSGFGFAADFQALFLKKATLNVVTLAVLFGAGEHFVSVPSAANASFLARLGDRSRYVRPGEILRAEANGNYVNLHTKDGVWPVRQSLADLLQQLPEQQFIRVSRSSVVNLAKVSSAQAESGSLSLVLDDDAHVRVARRRTSSVRKAHRNFSEDLQARR